jgi:hypothetical protein
VQQRPCTLCGEKRKKLLTFRHHSSRGRSVRRASGNTLRRFKSALAALAVLATTLLVSAPPVPASEPQPQVEVGSVLVGGDWVSVGLDRVFEPPRVQWRLWCCLGFVEVD